MNSLSVMSVPTMVVPLFSLMISQSRAEDFVHSQDNDDRDNLCNDACDPEEMVLHRCGDFHDELAWDMALPEDWKVCENWRDDRGDRCVLRGGQCEAECGAFESGDHELGTRMLDARGCSQAKNCFVSAHFSVQLHTRSFLKDNFFDENGDLLPSFNVSPADEKEFMPGCFPRHPENGDVNMDNCLCDRVDEGLGGLGLWDLTTRDEKGRRGVCYCGNDLVEGGVKFFGETLCSDAEEAYYTSTHVGRFDYCTPMWAGESMISWMLTCSEGETNLKLFNDYQGCSEDSEVVYDGVVGGGRCTGYTLDKEDPLVFREYVYPSDCSGFLNKTSLIVNSTDLAIESADSIAEPEVLDSVDTNAISDSNEDSITFGSDESSAAYEGLLSRVQFALCLITLIRACDLL